MKSAIFSLFKGKLLVRKLSMKSGNVSDCFFSSMLFVVLVFSGAAHGEEWNATLLWGNKLPLGTPASGIVTAVNVTVGDFVKKDAVLLSLDSRQQRAEVLAQKASLKRAGNDNDEAGRELERTQELYDRTLLADHDLEVAVIHRDAAEANLQMTKARLVSAELALEYTIVKAPFDAWVVSRDVAVGQTIVSRLQATPLFELVEAGFMLARISVPEKELSTMHKKKKATIAVAGKKYSGQIAHVALEPAKPDSAEYVVDVMFNSGKAMLRSGLSAKVNFK